MTALMHIQLNGNAFRLDRFVELGGIGNRLLLQNTHLAHTGILDVHVEIGLEQRLGGNRRIDPKPVDLRDQHRQESLLLPRDRLGTTCRQLIAQAQASSRTSPRWRHRPVTTAMIATIGAIQATEAIKLILGKGKEVFNLANEPTELRDRYGRNTFGQECLAARRMVEAGVPYVTISFPGGWDTHANNFEAVQELSSELDAGWATLMQELQERGLLESTTIIWLGEFGRTPAINRGNGRDHYPRAWTTVLAGGGNPWLGSLLMLVGVVDHQVGTRNIRELHGFGAGWLPVKVMAVIHRMAIEDSIVEVLAVIRGHHHHRPVHRDPTQ